jgi:hypothetical protein
MNYSQLKTELKTLKAKYVNNYFSMTTTEFNEYFTTQGNYQLARGEHLGTDRTKQAQRWFDLVK